MKKVKQGYSVKDLGGAGAEPEQSAKIGGIGNKKGAKDETKSGKHGSK